MSQFPLSFWVIIITGILIVDGLAIWFVLHTRKKNWQKLTHQLIPGPASGLQYKDLEHGTGPLVSDKDRIKVDYIGRLYPSGKVFDNSYQKGKPLECRIGIGQVIKGWDLGIPGMHVGGKRVLLIPPDMAYGPQGSPPRIPPNASLIFEVTIQEVITSGS